MTELKNLASTCAFGELHQSLLTCKIVDGIRSEKVRDVLLRKGAEMTLEKAIGICHTDEVTKLQMKKMSNDKEVSEISKKKMWRASKQKKQVGELDKVVKSDQKNGLYRNNDRKKCKFCRRIHKSREYP